MAKKQQEQRRRGLYSLLGDLPDRKRRIKAKTVSVTKRGGCVLEKLVLDLNGIESVPACFVKPKSGGPFPCMLYNHGHFGDYAMGKNEFLRGRPNDMQMPPYAEALTSRGMAALCIDAWLFGERRGPTESELFKQMLWHGQVLWGMMVYDSLRAVDYLSSRSDVDADRIGTMGMSMGSTMAWWLAALDTRIKVCVDICCLTDFQAIIKSRGLDGHGIYYYVPSLLKHFTTSQINALIAPRPHLGIAGNRDPLTPPAGLARIDRELSAVYRKMGHADAWRLLRSNTAHFETAQMRAAIMSFLEEHL